MQNNKEKKRLAILGGGPSGLFMFKRLIEAKEAVLEISIFEKKKQLGAGMPYSIEGANVEHITNVSDNEIPKIVTSIEEWVQTAPKEILDRFNITPANFNEYKVLPRLFFGEYLNAQFELLLVQAKEIGVVIDLHKQSKVVDIIDDPEKNEVRVELEDGQFFNFDHVIVCTGHNWPSYYEGKVSGYFDSPYPPSKLALKLNHPVALKGSSLTAIDAIRTLSRKNGTFETNSNGKLCYQLAAGSEQFKLMMHSRNGLLPAVRFHLEDSHLGNDNLLTVAELEAHKAANNGFLSLDYIFEHDFIAMFRDKKPEFYERIKNMNIESFVEMMMDFREKIPPFDLLRREYEEAARSIKRKESVYWKEMLAVLSFAMNYPAKYLSAEDMQRLQKVLMPLISIVIAFVPQSSCNELLALHDAGVIDIVAVGDDSEIEVHDKGGITYHYETEEGEKVSAYFETFVDCVGQPHLSYEDFPFKSLYNQGVISQARLRFKSDAEGERALREGNKKVEKDGDGSYYLKVPGITINDQYQVVDDDGNTNNRISMMAVPYIGGFNPDYSGLDFSEAASAKILKALGVRSPHRGYSEKLKD